MHCKLLNSNIRFKEFPTLGVPEMLILVLGLKEDRGVSKQAEENV